MNYPKELDETMRKAHQELKRLKYNAILAISRRFQNDTPDWELSCWIRRQEIQGYASAEYPTTPTADNVHQVIEQAKAHRRKELPNLRALLEAEEAELKEVQND